MRYDDVYKNCMISHHMGYRQPWPTRSEGGRRLLHPLGFGGGSIVQTVIRFLGTFTTGRRPL